MVTLSAHGGGCCGMRHLRGFGPAENDNPDLINDALADAINGQGVEVVLNGTQVQNYPRVLERLAELGFVLDGHWRNGNHGQQNFRNAREPTEGELGSHNYRFTRADRRQPLGEGPLRTRWAGMVITPGLQGLLPMMHNARNGAGHDAFLRAHYSRPLPRGYTSLWTRGGGHADLNEVRAGDTVRVTNRASRRYNGEFTVVRMSGEWDRRVHMHDGNENIDFNLTSGSVTLVRRGEGGRVYERGRVGQRVQYCGNVVWNNNWNNGEYATIRRVADWPYIQVEFDRQPGANRRVNVHAQYLVLRDDDTAEANVIPDPAPENLPARQVQVHENAEVLLERPAPRVEEAVAPAAPTTLFRTYHNVYRDGRTGAGYDSYAAARTARGRDGRIDCKHYLSDGTTNMVENVPGPIEQDGA